MRNEGLAAEIKIKLKLTSQQALGEIKGCKNDQGNRFSAKIQMRAEQLQKHAEEDETVIKAKRSTTLARS